MLIEDLATAGLADEVSALKAAIEEDPESGGTLAIVSAPFGGREAFLDLAENLLPGEVRRIEITSLPPPGDIPAIDEKRPLVISGAQHLFRRQIDGFAGLDQFIERASRKEATVITGWNREAWVYLAAAMGIDRVFATEIDIPPLESDGLRAIVTRQFGPTLPEIVDSNAKGRTGLLEFETHSFGTGGRSIPLPKLRRARLVNRSDRKAAIEQIFFEQLCQVSGGNPGVALAKLKQANDDGPLSPADIDSRVSASALHHEEAFLLWIIASNEALPHEHICDILDRHEERLQTLRTANLVSVTDGTVSLIPEALPATLAQLDRHNLRWASS